MSYQKTSGTTGVKPEKRYTIHAASGAVKDMKFGEVLTRIPDLYEGDIASLKRMGVGKSIVLTADLSVERTA